MSTTLRQGRVGHIPIIWIAPPQTELRRLVIWLPGFSGNKESTLPYLYDLARHGYVALSYDPYQHGERMSETVEELRARVRGNVRRYFWPILACSAADAAIMIEWAIESLEISGEVGMGGISMGGDIAVAAAGLDRRIVAVAACLATPDWLRPGSFEPPGQADAEALACYDDGNPLTHLERFSHHPAITFQCGADDRQVPPDGAQRFIAALRETYAGTPDRLDVTLHAQTAHVMTEQLWNKSLSWFERYLPVEERRSRG